MALIAALLLFAALVPRCAALALVGVPRGTGRSRATLRRPGGAIVMLEAFGEHRTIEHPTHR